MGVGGVSNEHFVGSTSGSGEGVPSRALCPPMGQFNLVTNVVTWL